MRVAAIAGLMMFRGGNGVYDFFELKVEVRTPRFTRTRLTDI